MDNQEDRHDLLVSRQNMASSETDMEFRPSLLTAVSELLIGGVLFVIAVAVGLFVFKGVSSVPYVIAFGVAAGTLVVGFYVVRFTRRAPRLVRVDGEGLSIWHREDETSVVWTDVREAIHESSYGLRWRLNVGSHDVVLRDDGFSVSQWDKLSKAVHSNLSLRGISVEHKGMAAAFDESEEEANSGTSG
jgi:hypothetical protein